MAELNRVPRHVGFIMDGNGRWAKARGKSRNYGHQKGADVIYEIVERGFNDGVEAISLYAFSTENWSRPQDEIDTIFDLLQKFIKKYCKKLIKEEIKLIISGDLDRIAPALKAECLRAIDLTKSFTGHILNIAINYGSRAEIVMSANELIRQGKTEITEEDINANLYTKGLPDMDLVVRTSGEARLSNFFMWQCAYAELYFTDVLWPDFHVDELEKAFEWFRNRKRRFGGIENV